jgi:hypothetical protein
VTLVVRLDLLNVLPRERVRAQRDPPVVDGQHAEAQLPPALDARLERRHRVLDHPRAHLVDQVGHPRDRPAQAELRAVVRAQDVAQDAAPAPVPDGGQRLDLVPAHRPGAAAQVQDAVGVDAHELPSADRRRVRDERDGQHEQDAHGPGGEHRVEPDEQLALMPEPQDVGEQERERRDGHDGTAVRRRVVGALRRAQDGRGGLTGIGGAQAVRGGHVRSV